MSGAIRIAAVAAVLLCAAFPAFPAGQDQRSADAVARALQARYQGVQDFSAEFAQTYRGGVLKTRSSSRGTVAVKKPGKMRWVYTSPERQEIVSDGQKTYWYLPEDKQVTVRTVGQDDQALPSLFLSGKGDISRDFTASFVKAPAADLLALKLVPRRSEPEYEYVVVGLDPSSLQLRTLTTYDRQGGESTLTLTNMKENRRLSDKDFVFRIPRGVNVVTDGTR